MRTIIAVCLTAALAVAPLTTQSAGDDKTLQNLKGTVQSKTVAGAIQAVPANAQIAVNDTDTAITGPASEAAVTLPDSSQVLIGQQSQVQLQAFNQANIATANFVIVNGKIRFTVRHPAGQKANYTFQTSTGQIAVRGTEGDVNAFGDHLQVNVYDLTDPTLPVHVTLDNGKEFDLGKGQSLISDGTGLTTTTNVTTVSPQTFNPFTEFGLPQNADKFGLINSGTAGGDITGPTTAIIGGAAAAAALVTLGNSGGKSPNPAVTLQPTPGITPTPAGSTPTPSTTGAPITVTSHNLQPQVAPPTPSPQIIAPPGRPGRPGPP